MKKNKSKFAFRGAHIFGCVFLLVNLVACVGVKPYEKEYLLGPLMNDQDLKKLSSDFPGNCVAPYERLGSSSAGSSNASSCPTCGG